MWQCVLLHLPYLFHVCLPVYLSVCPYFLVTSVLRRPLCISLYVSMPTHQPQPATAMLLGYTEGAWSSMFEQRNPVIFPDRNHFGTLASIWLCSIHIKSGLTGHSASAAFSCKKPGHSRTETEANGTTEMDKLFWTGAGGQAKMTLDGGGSKGELHRDRSIIKSTYQ